MKAFIKLTLLTMVASSMLLMMGCGVSQEDYFQVYVELAASQAQVAELQTVYGDTQAKYSEAQSKVYNLQAQIDQLKVQYELVGDTPLVTAQNLVQWYYRTHIYSEGDSFVCGDMAVDLWDMLKAHGINAILQVGNPQQLMRDIIDTNHVWVQAEVSPGRYLALDPTVGYAFYEKDYPLYYTGWWFDNPKEYKKSVFGGGRIPIENPETPPHVPGLVLPTN